MVRGMAPGLLSIWSNGHFLTRAHLLSEVKKAMEQAGMEASNSNGHSFRIGAASTAAAHGVEDSLIKTLGRWESDAYQRYIKIPRDELAISDPTLTIENVVGVMENMAVDRWKQVWSRSGIIPHSQLEDIYQKYSSKEQR